MTSLRQLRTDLRQLKVSLAEVEIYEAEILSKLKEFEEQCTQHQISFQSAADARNSAALDNPQVIAKLSVLAHEINTIRELLQSFTENTEIKTLVALFCAEGHTVESAKLEAKKVAERLIESWVDIIEKAESVDKTILIIDDSLDSRIPYPLRGGKKFDVSFDAITQGLDRDFRDAFTLIEKCHPYCASEKSKKQCEDLIIKKYCAVRTGCSKLEDLLREFPEGTLRNFLKDEGITEDIAKEAAHSRWKRAKEAHRYFDEELYELSELAKPFYRTDAPTDAVAALRLW
jgi:hypothetical protein